MLSVFILLVRESDNIKSLQLPMKWRLSEQASAMKNLQSQTFEIILPG